ncbi:RHS repeat-associated core domain-containing protein [Halothermothrix orenii]|nr:RHS repeat-associated core domain-containing protein [Halothermothrix orenii]
MLIFILLFQMFFIVFDSGVIFANNGQDENDEEEEDDEESEENECDHPVTSTYYHWEYTSNSHWLEWEVYCVNCGKTLSTNSSSPEPHNITSSYKTKNSSKSRCTQIVTESCSTCGYTHTYEKTYNHTRGTTCSKCGTYYPTHEEEAEQKTGESNEKSGEGEDELDEGEEANDNADQEINDGEQSNTDANNEYGDTESDLSDAGEENDNAETDINNADENIGSSNDCTAEADQYNTSAEEGMGNSEYSQGESSDNFDETLACEEQAEGYEQDVNDIYNDLEETEDGNTDLMEGENNSANSDTAGDPVRYTTGEYVSKSTDLQINSVEPRIKVVRSYSNFDTSSFSFGRGWNFNYDTRIIIGIRANYIEQQEELQELAELVDETYQEAVIAYQEAMDAACESVEFAKEAVEDAEKAVNAARDAKDYALTAKNLAESGKINASEAKYYADSAFDHLNKCLEYADNSIQSGKEAENQAKFAREKATEARNIADIAIDLAESAVYHANRSGKQSVIDAAYAALNRANTLKTNALNEIDEADNNIETARKIKSDAQDLKNKVNNLNLADKIRQAKNTAENNYKTAEKTLVIARDVLELAEDTFNKVNNTLVLAEARLNEASQWKKELNDNYTVIENIDKINNRVQEIARQALLNREYSEAGRYRNQYNVDWSVNPARDEIGIGKIVLIDDKGTPHIYKILSEPDFESKITFPDGLKNYYPEGSLTEPVTITDDRLEILPDGKYLLTKKDKTTYLYSYFGRLLKIEEPNGRYLKFGYNENEQLVSIEDTFGRKVKIERVNGKIVKITDPVERVYTYDYEGNNLVAFTDPEGYTRRYSYNENGITGLTYPDGSGWKYYYTELNGIKVIDYQQDAAGNIIDFEYYPGTGETVVINRKGNKTTYRYNERHLTEEEINANYQSIIKRYDNNNNLVSITNQRGYTTSYTYDKNNNITSVTDAAGSIYFTYNDFNKITSITDKNGYTTNFYYDDRGNLTQIVYPDGSNKQYIYNDLGLLVVEIDQLGNRINYTYDGYGNITEKVYPDGSREKYEYDKVGRLIKRIKPDGGQISYHYDNNDNIIRVVDELGNEETFKYNSRGKIIEKIDPRGNVTRYEYDDRNNLSKIIDAEGNIKEIFYDEAENMTRKILAENVSYVYRYDNLDRLITATQVETGITTSYEYDPVGNLIAITDGEGRTTRFDYDGLNRRVREIDPLNNTVVYRYYPNNQLKSITDKNGNTTNFKYDCMGRLTEVINPIGERVQYKYDAAGNLVAEIDPMGNTTRYQYDCMNRLVKEIDPAGNEIQYEYDLSGNLIKVTDPEGNTTSYTYDLKGRVIKETNALGYSKTYEYDAVGNLITFTNEAGVKTTYKYDGLNRLVEIKDALGNSTKIGYTPLGKIAWREDALGNRTEFTYDSAGRLVKETDPEGNTVVYTYDKAGNLIKVTDELGYTTNYCYDKLNRLIEVVDALNNKVEYSYDPRGNLTMMVNEMGNTYQYHYDALDRLVKEINYQGKEQTYSYDANGNLIAKKDFNGNTTTYNYDELNRLLEVIFNGGNKKRFSYNRNGMMTRAQNDNLLQRYYYDGLSRLIKVEVEDDEGENYKIEYQYNELGQKTRVIYDDSNNLKDRVTGYEYDELMRLSRVELPDGGEIKYRYDKLNRIITRINNNRTATSYTYTPDGQVETITHWKGFIGHNQNIIQSYGYVYNARDERVLQVEENGEITAYQYDPAGRLAKVYYPFSDRKKIEDLKERFYYGLLPEWPEPYKYGLNIEEPLSWDKENNLYNQLNELTGKLEGSLAGMPGVGNSTRGQKGKGRLPELIISQGEGSLNFTDRIDLPYDVRNRVEELYSRIKNNGWGLDIYGDNFWVEEFTYDPAGNITEKRNGWGKIEYKYNDANQLAKAGNRQYEYDSNGNLIREELGHYYAEYHYNYENRLIKAVNNSHPHFLGGKSPFKGSVSYTYGPLGRKVKKVTDPQHGAKVGITKYIYDGTRTNVLVEYEIERFGGDHPGNNKPGKGHKHNNNPFNNAGKINRINEYYYGNGLIAMNYLSHPDRGRIHYGNNVSYYHKDALGSIILMTGRNGQVIDRYEYDAYGNPYSGRFEQGNNMNSYGFTGQRYEARLGVYTFAYRTYNPRVMRWITPDPVRDGMNWYTYVNGDPVNLWDPLGLCDIDPDSWRNIMKEQQPMMRGDDVEQVQTFLNQQGYDVTVDGILGPETAGAVRDYQEDKGLSVDGVVGPNTREEIKKDLGIEDVRHEIYFSHDTDKVYWTDNTGKIIKSWQASDDIIG